MGDPSAAAVTVGGPGESLRPVKASHPYFATLDAVRGIAALAIVVRHMPQFFGADVFPQSYLAVDLFFVLSGVVIANAYEAKLQTRLSGLEFMAARWIRLWPMMVFGAACGAINSYFGEGGIVPHHDILLAVLAGSLFIPAYRRPGGGALNGPAWSLTFELVANAAYAGFLRWLGWRTLTAICAVCGVVLCVAAVYKGHLDTGYTLKSVPFGLARVGFSFFAGVAIYRLRERLPKFSGGLGAALLCGVVALALTAQVPPTNAIFPLLAVLIAFPLIVAVGMRIDLVGRTRRIAEVLGAISYPIYAIHMPLAYLAAYQLEHRGIAVNWATGLVFMAAVVCLSWVLAMTYDHWARAKLTSAFKRIRWRAPHRQRPGPSVV